MPTALPNGGPAQEGGPAVSERYGVVVDSVNVSVLEYVPVRSASLAPIACLNVAVTDSLEVGFDHVLTVPSPCSGCGSENAPLTRWPGEFELRSATVSVASPAVEMTV